MLVYFLASFPKVAINARGDEIAYLIREMRRAQTLMLNEVGIGFIDPRILAKYEEAP